MPDPPADVTDVMLWGLAADVACHHQPDHTGHCAHPFCRGGAWPCPPHHLAVRGDHAARRPATVTAQARATVAAHPPPPVAYPRRTPSWVAVQATSGPRPQPGSDAATVLRLLQPGPATTETLARDAGLPAARVARALAALHHHGLAAPVTQGPRPALNPPATRDVPAAVPPPMSAAAGDPNHPPRHNIRTAGHRRV